LKLSVLSVVKQWLLDILPLNTSRGSLQLNIFGRHLFVVVLSLQLNGPYNICYIFLDETKAKLPCRWQTKQLVIIMEYQTNSQCSHRHPDLGGLLR